MTRPCIPEIIEQIPFKFDMEICISRPPFPSSSELQNMPQRHVAMRGAGLPVLLGQSDGTLTQCLCFQFWLTMQYLSEMSEEQTLVMYSGHPLGLFPSNAGAPRAVITNGMVIPNYSSRQSYDNMFALGVTM
jgi:urocanate hydratase